MSVRINQAGNNNLASHGLDACGYVYLSANLRNLPIFYKDSTLSYDALF